MVCVVFYLENKGCWVKEGVLESGGVGTCIERNRVEGKCCNIEVGQKDQRRNGLLLHSPDSHDASFSNTGGEVRQVDLHPGGVTVGVNGVTKMVNPGPGSLATLGCGRLHHTLLSVTVALKKLGVISLLMILSFNSVIPIFCG